VVVPHGELGQVPFAALADRRTGRFLVEDVAVSVMPSAAAFTALRARATPAWTGAAAAFAPLHDVLPASAREVVAFAAAVPGARGSLGAEATERAVRDALVRPGIVHVATHGDLSARNPMFSRLELARGREGSSADDGRLEAHELLTLDVRSALVFLSGCETGARRGWSDELVQGTGDLALSQALLAAGAANVVSTLWRIDDAGAAAFAAHFYAALRSAPAAMALAAAQRATARDPRWASPYHWAGYTLSGDGRVGGGGAGAPAQGVGRASVASR
jgi:CHAT domain-containing protein